MPVDVRVNEVITQISVTDSAALLTPQMLELIVQTVLHRLNELERNADNQARERNIGAARNTDMD